jgi:hypothetical protein
LLALLRDSNIKGTADLLEICLAEHTTRKAERGPKAGVSPLECRVQAGDLPIIVACEKKRLVFKIGSGENVSYSYLQARHGDQAKS